MALLAPARLGLFGGALGLLGRSLGFALRGGVGGDRRKRLLLQLQADLIEVEALGRHKARLRGDRERVREDRGVRELLRGAAELKLLPVWQGEFVQIVSQVNP